MLKPSVMKFLWVAGPKILAGGLQFLLMFLLMRHFHPREFGSISVCMSAVILCDSVVGGATDSGVLRLAPSLGAQDTARSLQYQQAGVVLKLIFVAIVAALVLLLARPLSRLLFQSPSGAGYLSISLVALLATLLMRSAQMQYQLVERFTSYGVADLANSALKFGGVALLLMVLHPSPGMVLAAYGLSTLTVAVVVFAANGALLPGGLFSQAQLLQLVSHVRWFVLVSATGTLISRMDLFLVSSLLGVASAGIYSAAQFVALVPQLIGSYIAVVFSPRVMPMWESGTLLKLYREVQLGLCLGAATVYLGAYTMLPRLSESLFPASFRQSEPVILALLPSGLCALINFPLTLLLLLFLWPRFLVALDCISLPLLVTAYAWVIPVHGVMGAAFVTTAAALVRTVVMQVAAWRLLHRQSLASSAVAVSLLSH